eukprot:TRINITY_DN50383_c0_g1_i1.p1 TRINITY_DN50383_c0_g1~~TRINITY_DN50383_c0_g1_i1.p1  ORF type:complete len:195 (+),score=37.44 TRINITY_DN50383_c0_g1_i1:154-738(+)
MRLRAVVILTAWLLATAGLTWVRPSQGPASSRNGLEISRRRLQSRGGCVVAVPRRVAGATIDKPPPPADLEDGDGDGEAFDVRFINNEERELIAQRWMMFAEGEEREILEKQVLPFRSSQMFTGKSRLCVAAFLGGTCEGIGTTEVRNDFSDPLAFFSVRRCLHVQALVTRPRVKSEAGTMILRALKMFAEASG